MRRASFHEVAKGTLTMPFDARRRMRRRVQSRGVSQDDMCRQRILLLPPEEPLDADVTRFGRVCDCSHHDTPAANPVRRSCISPPLIKPQGEIGGVRLTRFIAPR